MSADLGWMAEPWPGLEHVIVTASATGYRADGQLIMAEEELVTVRYQLRCDAGWRFTGLDISVTGAAGQRDLAVSADGAGEPGRPAVSRGPTCPGARTSTSTARR